MNYVKSNLQINALLYKRNKLILIDNSYNCNSLYFCDEKTLSTENYG